MARYSKPQRDLSNPGVHDIGLAIPKPPKIKGVRQSRRVNKQAEPNWPLIFLTLIVAAIAILIGVSGGLDVGSLGGGSHVSHSHRR